MSVKSNPSRNSQIVTKTTINSMTSGISWHANIPISPKMGDAYMDVVTGFGYIYDGKAWIIMSHGNMEPKRLEPTEEEMKKHPAIKEAWDDYIILRKLIGI